MEVPTMQYGRQLSLNIVPPAPPRAPAPPPPPYTVALRDTELGLNERIKLETRFCRVLEERLGAPAEIGAMLALLQDAEFREQPLTPEERDAGLRWQRAYAAARQAALQDLAAISAAWFEVQPT
jgi:hypothetical protein